MCVIKKSLFKATLTITLFSVATRAMGFFNRIYLSRAIGAEGLGLYQVVCSIFAVLITITSSGLPISVSKQTAKLRAANNFDGGHSTVSAAVIIGVSFSLVITILVVLFKNQISLMFADDRCLPILMVLLPGVTASAVYSSYRGGLWGQKNFFAYSFCEFIEEFILVATGVILVSRVSGIFEGAKNAAMSVSIAYVSAAVIAVFIYFYYDGKMKSPKGYVRPLINSAAPLTGIRVASAIITSLLAIILPTRLMLSGLSSSEALAEFGIASGMTLPLLFIPGTVVGAMALALIPEISGNKDKTGSEVTTQIKNAVSFALMMALIVLIVFISIGKDIGILLYNNERAGLLLMQSSALMIPICISQISSSILNALGKEYKSLKNYILGATTMMFSVWFLPPLIGIYSMIIGFAVSFSLTAVLNTIIIFKNIKYDFAFIKTLLVTAALFIFCAVFCFFINMLLKMFAPLVISVLLSALLSMILYLFSLAALKINNLHILIGKLTKNRLTKTRK